MEFEMDAIGDIETRSCQEWERTFDPPDSSRMRAQYDKLVEKLQRLNMLIIRARYQLSKAFDKEISNNVDKWVEKEAFVKAIVKGYKSQYGYK